MSGDIQVRPIAPAARTQGRPALVEVRGSSTPSGHAIATFTDVTDARHAALAPETSQRRLARALEATELGLWECDLRGDTLFLGDSCARLLGLPPVQTELAPETVLALVPRVAARAVSNWRRELLSGHVDRRSVEHQVLRAPGASPLWLLTSAQVSARSHDGRPLKLVGTCKDISERMQAAAQLRVALDAADQANHAKSEFLATMSHEIRTPLNGVIGLAKLLSAADLPPVEHESVMTLKGCAKSLLRVLDNILDFSKVEAGHPTLEEVPTDLAALACTRSQAYSGSTGKGN